MRSMTEKKFLFDVVKGRQFFVQGFEKKKKKMFYRAKRCSKVCQMFKFEIASIN